MPDLVVNQPFDKYKRCDRITDAKTVNDIEGSEFARFVVRAADIPPPPPAAAAPNRAQAAPGTAAAAAPGTAAAAASGAPVPLAPVPSLQITPEPTIEHGVLQPLGATEAAPQGVAGPAVSVAKETSPTPPSAS